MSNGRVFVAGVLFVVGVLAVVAGVIYLVEPAHSLPSFFPGHGLHISGRHSKRGMAGVVVGAVLLLAAAGVAATAGRRHRSRVF